MKLGQITTARASAFLTRSQAVPAAYRDRVIEVTRVSVMPRYRRKGHASELMRVICGMADRAAQVLLLSVEPRGEGGLDADGLRAWYERRGFEVIQEGPLLMARPPATEKEQT